MVPSDSALSMLRREAPHKRLVLVDSEKQNLQVSSALVSRLQKSGKSKSLELFDLSKIDQKLLQFSKAAAGSSSKAAPQAIIPKERAGEEGARKRLNGLFMSKTPLLHRKERPKACAGCKIITPTVSSSQALCTQCRAAQSHIEVDSAVAGGGSPKRDSQSKGTRNSPTSTPKRYDLKSLFDRTMAKGSPTRNIKRKTEIIKSYADSPLFNRKHRFQDQEPLTKHGRSLSMGRKSGSKRRSSTESDNDLQPADPSPRISGLSSTLDNIMGRGRAGRGPSTPKEKRSITSSSPIRQILNSPLLGRRYRKSKQLIESSDDEQQASGEESHSEQVGLASSTGTSRQYRDLETFQKAQLRQKVSDIFFLFCPIR